MTAIPPEAITVAAVFIHDEECCDGDTKTCGRWRCGSDAENRFHSLHVRHVEFYRDKAQGILKAAAPYITPAAWRDGYGLGRDDEADNLPLRDAP